MNTIESQLKEQEERQSQPTTPSNYSQSFVMQEETCARATKDTDWCMVLALPQLDPKQQRPGNTCSQGDMQLKEDFAYFPQLPLVTSRFTLASRRWLHFSSPSFGASFPLVCTSDNKHNRCHCCNPFCTRRRTACNLLSSALLNQLLEELLCRAEALGRHRLDARVVHGWEEGLPLATAFPRQRLAPPLVVRLRAVACVCPKLVPEQEEARVLETASVSPRLVAVVVAEELPILAPACSSVVRPCSRAVAAMEVAAATM